MPLHIQADQTIKYSVKYLKITISVLFLCIVTLFLKTPEIFMKSFMDGVTAWAYHVLPTLFPFAVLTQLSIKFFPKSKFSVCRKLFGIPADGIYLSSLLCGYPVGAKSIADSLLDSESSTCACAFCSSASPVFIVASVGTSMLKNTAATVVLATAHMLSTIICGLFFRKKTDNAVAVKTQNFLFEFGDISNAVASAVLSVLSVGGLIALFYMLTDMVKSLLPTVVAESAAVGFLLGLAEMTNGVISICAVCDTFSATVLCSFLIGFGGLCVFAQSMTFLATKKVSPLKFLQMRLIQGSVATVLAFALGKAVGL